MSVHPILYADHAALRTKAKRVSSFDASLKKLAEDMVETMHAAHGVGLAANQIGVLLQIAVIQIPEEADLRRRQDGATESSGQGGTSDSPSSAPARAVQTEWREPIYLVNPEVIRRSGERIVEEGCLSLPGYRAKLKRSETVSVKARDLSGKEFRIRNATGLLAQAIEHETDHLNGILYIDHLESLDELYKIGPREEEEVETAEASEDGQAAAEEAGAPTGGGESSPAEEAPRRRRASSPAPATPTRSSPRARSPSA